MWEERAGMTARLCDCANGKATVLVPYWPRHWLYFSLRGNEWGVRLKRQAELETIVRTGLSHPPQIYPPSAPLRLEPGSRLLEHMP